MATLGRVGRSTTLLAGIAGGALGRELAQAARATLSLSSGLAALTAGLATAGLAAAAAAAAAAKFTSAALTEIPALARLSDQIGVTTQGLVAFQTEARRAGQDPERATQGLTALAGRLGELESGSLSAADAFRKLGLSGQDLKGLAPDAAFARLSDRFARLPGGAEKAAAAFGVFGASAKDVVTQLQQGSGGLAKAAEDSAKLGLSFSRLDAQKVADAGVAFGQLHDVLVGVGRVVAIQLAPYLAAAAEELGKVATQGEGIGPKVANAFEWAAKAVAKVADVANDLWIGLKLVAAGLLDLTATAAAQVAKLLDVAGRLPGVFGQVNRYQAGLARDVGGAAAGASAELLRQVAADVLKPSAARGVEEFFARVRAGAGRAAQGNAAFRLSLEGVQGLLTKFEALFRAGEETFARTRTPLEQFGEKLKALDLQARVGAVSWDTYGRAVAGSLLELEKSNDAQVRLAAAPERGTREARAAINEFEARVKVENLSPQERIARAVEGGRRIQEEQKRIQQGIADALRAFPVKELKLP